MVVAHMPAGIVLGFLIRKTFILKKLKISWFKLLGIVVLGSIFPDFDLALQLVNQQAIYNHRKFLTHLPFFYVGLTLVLFILISLKKINKRKYLLINWWLFLLGVFGHLVLDSYFVGVLWIWPLSPRKFGLVSNPFAEVSGFGEWLSVYFRSIHFVPEIMIVIMAIICLLLIKRENNEN